jgi:hypothetical protein
MFLCAVARPRHDVDTDLVFDGKIGMWPFAHRVAAQRRTKHRQRGEYYWKPITVTKNVYRQFLIDFVIPAINAKWPECDRDEPIFIQQDNAPAHIPPDDQQFIDAVHNANACRIFLYNQPPRSPDMNVLDLGFFRSLQTKQFTFIATNLDTLIDNVLKAFNSMPWSTLNNIFITLMTCLSEIILCDGDNHYDLPHIGKAKMLAETNGEPILSLRAPERAMEYKQMGGWCIYDANELEDE